MVKKCNFRYISIFFFLECAFRVLSLDVFDGIYIFLSFIGMFSATAYFSNQSDQLIWKIRVLYAEKHSLGNRGCFIVFIIILIATPSFVFVFF